MHWIEHPSDPRELLLAWQAAPSVQDRSRWAVGRLWLDGAEAIFQYLEADEFSKLNLGRSLGQLRTAGYSGYPAFEVNRRPPGGFRGHVLAAFLRRVPPSSRQDYPRYLEYFRVQPGTRLSPMSLLAITEGRLPSDGFSLVDPLDPALSTVDALFEIAGFQHVRSDDMLRADQQLVLERDASNPVDPTAVQVISSRGQLVGYVNRLQSPTVCQWIGHRRLSCWVARLNGQPGAPRAYGLMRVRPA
jgi:hypothetical protein